MIVNTDTLASSLSVLHWDNGCNKCPLLEQCKESDKNEDNNQCIDIWTQYVEDIEIENSDGYKFKESVFPFHIVFLFIVIIVCIFFFL